MKFINKLCVIWVNWNQFKKNYLKLSLWKCQEMIINLFNKCGQILGKNIKKELRRKNLFIILIINNMMDFKDLLLKC